MADRDPLWHQPVFVLAPARSNSTVVTAMLGGHPQLHAFPELALFRRPKVGDLLNDPPGWRGPTAEYRLAGLLRALAHLHHGRQDERAIAGARAWLAHRRAWTGTQVLDHLLDAAAPRTGVEKSPESAARDDTLATLNRLYPRARFLHLTRHPGPSVRSMHRNWTGLGYWDVGPAAFEHFCLGVWTFTHERIRRFLSTLPPDRALTARTEDILDRPEERLPTLCAWLRIDRDPAPMLHPEATPYAHVGPAGARGGGDLGFLQDPARRPATTATLDGWRADPWLLLRALRLADAFGYSV